MPIQLQDLAKQVLFGETLEEKLSFPRSEIIDTLPGSPIKTPRKLSRPHHLRLHEDGVKANHPSNAKLVDERERGRLLHFFGNHELLATELMALVLLKFPEAPSSFRLGVLETLKEEQIHTQLYIHRMRQCGVEFGELPLSDYFWKSVSSMEDPLDYVTRLSLTFEQANLDYSFEYKKIFESVGDDATASLLDRIYRDEIQHVGFGLKWFRRWKDSGRTDWEVFRKRLVFPLSPSRAKGSRYNIDGRIQAGLDDSFISDLQVFHQSRGRTPSVLWFNPDAECYAAEDPAKELSMERTQLQDDLEILPLFYSRQDDILLMSKPPEKEHLRNIQNSGFTLPEILIHGDQKSAPTIPRKIGQLRPWSWTPDSLAFFRKTFESLTRHIKLDTLWNASIRDLFSKKWSAQWGKQMARETEENKWIAPPEVYGEPVTDLENLNTVRDTLKGLGYENVVFKAPFGTAANGNRCILSNEILGASTLAWLGKQWKDQGYVIVEPWLDRVFDFSVQLEAEADKARTIAFTRLLNNHRGQFKGVVTANFCQGVDPEIARFLMEPKEGRPRVYHFYETLVISRLFSEMCNSGYMGPLGIDAFIYRSPKGTLQLKTLVEINPRMTMGRIGYELGKRNAARSVGLFQILTHSQLSKTDTPNFIDYSRQLTTQYPTVLTKETNPRLVSSSSPLNDPYTAKKFLAVYHVREKLSELPL
ncbi:MAG: hypothetical protein CMI17_06845 [Opitutaceae bacterium]|nr:hypothetical protein [Opitutaceae bacterium]